MRGVSKMARLSQRPLAAFFGGLALLHAGSAHADSLLHNVNWSDLIASSDWSSRVLDSLFNMDGTTQNATGALFGWFTAFVCVIVILWLGYSGIVQVVKVAETGKVLTASFTGWVPLRVALSIILMFPSMNGFSLGQYGVVTSAKASIGMANIEEKVVMNKVGPQALPLATPMIPGSRQVVLGVMDSEICRMLINKASNNPDLVPEPAIIDDGNGTVSISYNMADGNGTTMPTCGLISISTPVRTATTTEYQSIDFSGIGEQQKTALTTLIKDVRSGLQNTITTLWTTRDVTALRSLNALFVAQSNAMNSQFSSIASSVVSTIRSSAGSTASDNSGTEQLLSLGWTGLGAYYLEIMRLNAEVVSVSSITPAVEPPSWAGTGPYLAQDLMPFLKSVSGYLARIDATLQTQDNPSPDGSSPRLYPDAHVSSDGMAVWTRVLTSLNLGSPVLQTIMNQFIMASSGSDWVDPLASMMGLGHLLIHLALTSIMLSLVASSATLSIGAGVAGFFTGQWEVTAAAAAATALSGVISRMIPLILTVFLFLLSAGVTLAYVLPMTPLLYWYAGVIGWFLLVVEAVAYVPLWFLAHMTFSGDGIHGKGIRGYEILFAIIFRPPMMVIGMMLSYTVFAAFSWLLMKTFVIGATFTLDRGYLLDNWVGMFAMIILYSGAELMTATLAFRLITTLPHHMASIVGFGAASRVDAEDFEKSTTRPVDHASETGRQIATQHLENTRRNADKSGDDGAGGDTLPTMDTTTAAQVRPITQTDV